jgi:hypothetical protein
VKLGLQQTPYLDFIESVYRYRWQGTNFTEREGLLSSSDFALAFRATFPRELGDVVAGYYNGDAYTKAESNDQQALMLRATLRPAPAAGVLSGLKLTAFLDDDRYARSDSKRRLLGAVTFEHRFANAAFEYVRATDRKTAASEEVDSSGYSLWVVPRTAFGLEGLLRLDRFRPDDDADGVKSRTILGVAYWFKLPKGVSAALMLDHDAVDYDEELGKPDERRIALHSLLQF